MKSVDYILIASGNPQSERWACRWFETGDLHGRGEIFQLCAEGFLWRIGRCQPRQQLAIHRDLLLLSDKERLVARMNSGALEWMRPLAEIGQATREFLILGFFGAGFTFVDGSAAAFGADEVLGGELLGDLRC